MEIPKETNKRGPNGPRNKMRMVLLVKGQPDCLFTKKEETSYELTYDGATHKLGKIGQDLANVLQSLNKNARIKSIKKSVKRANHDAVTGAGRLIIKKSNKNTTIEVAAPTQGILIDKIAKIQTFLEKNNSGYTLRCNWSCEYDAGHQEEMTPKQKEKYEKMERLREIAKKTTTKIKE